MRYALYYCPDKKEQLTDLGSQWLGRDAFTNTPVTQPDVDGISKSEFWEYTETPRRYGFHGTLKPPFRAADGVSMDHVHEVVQAFARQTAPFELDGLSPNRLGKFLALTPTQPSTDLDTLARRAITALDGLRAPLSEADIARRRKADLTPEQDAYMLKWGYPYVFEFFRFHLTLSGKLSDKTALAAMQRAALSHFAPVLGQPVRINQITLFIEDEDGGPFRVADTFRFEGASQ